MLDLIKNHSVKSKANVDRLLKHVQETWRFNVTLLDVEYFDNAQGTRETYDLGFDLFKCEVHFPADEMVTKPSKPDRLFDHMSPFFTEVANAIKFLGSRLQVEVVLGDYVDIADQINHSLYNTSHSGTGTDSGLSSSSDFPSQYDRVHLSNVP
jgi:hypothetical protein